MQIKDVSIIQVSGCFQGPFFPAGSRQANMLDIYPEFNSSDWSKSTAQKPYDLSAIYVEIVTDEGISGLFGPIDDDQVYIIQTYLKPCLVKRDPLAIELLYDHMIRMHRHGRSGFFMKGVSAVDCALWDLKGKLMGLPIYRLLGGPMRSEVPAYASMLGFSVDPIQAVEVAIQYKEMGYKAQKWFFRYGPGDGEEGKDKNVAMIHALREALGVNYPIMADAYMGWDVAYTLEMLPLLEPYHLTWVEEPIPPEHVEGFSRIHAITSVPLATGEHVYTRWQVLELLKARAVDYIQTDPDWTGGITELIKICSVASAYEVPVVAHGHSLLAALHVAGSQSPSVVPMVEYLVRFQPEKQYFHLPIYQPENGVIPLPQQPGLGYSLDESKITKKIER